MRTIHLIAIIPVLCLMAYTSDVHQVTGTTQSPTASTTSADPRSSGTDPGVLDFDILLTTCALFVAVRSNALEGPLAFGREFEDGLVQWNVCKGGKRVACVEVPTANGDTLITGIPWTRNAWIAQ